MRFTLPVTVQSKRQRIRDTALRLFAHRGISATSLRDVADASDVSLGLVQHHFRTKDRLVEVIDAHVLTELSTALTGPLDRDFDDAIAQHGHRVMTLVTTHPTIVDYVGRALLDDRAFGSAVFDELFRSGRQRWTDHRDQHLAPTDLDVTWAALNPLILVLGTIIFRSHVNRNLPESLTTATQANRWMESVNNLLRNGLYN